MDPTITLPGAFALVGPGRAGSAVALALHAAGWRAVAVAGRSPDRPAARALAARLGAAVTGVADAGRGADVVVLAVPDAAVAEVARQAAAGAGRGALVVHLSGALGLDALAGVSADRPDLRTGSVHPLVSMPSAELGAARLAGAWCAVAGDPATVTLAEALGGHPFVVADAARPVYHAAASVAANHVVALLGQVERLAAAAGVPHEAFLPLVRSAVENAADLGAAGALTGPVARGDVGTVAAHLDALADRERAPYRILAREAMLLGGRDDPAMAALLGTEVGS